MSDTNADGRQGDSGQSQSMTIQEKVEHFFHTVFGKWGVIVTNHTCKVFWLSILFFLVLCGGMSQYTNFEDESLVWTPADNNSLRSRNKGNEMFPSKSRFIGIIAEVKEPESDSVSIINLKALAEVKKFTEQMLETQVEINGTKIKYTDVCSKVGDECLAFESLLQFGYEFIPQMRGPPKREWKLEQKYANDQKLLEAVQTGKIGPQVIELSSIVGGTEPKDITQDLDEGTNDLKSAKAIMLGFPYLIGDLKREELELLEAELEKQAISFSEDSEHTNIFMFSQYGLQQSFSGDLQNDLGFVQVSVSLVAVYCILFMGSCSPIHFRSAAAGITLLCVGLSFGASQGLAFLVGGKVAGIHNLLPFLLIGIGVDDMFVISSNIDQTDPRLPVEKRMQIGLQHAGSSITITSFTNAIAFFLGCTSSLDALSSFCFFAGLGVLMLYLTSISVFSAFMVWDIKRQIERKGDCCGACMCNENTIICCKGFCLTATQKSYPYQGSEEDEPPKEKYSNGTQKFLHEKVSYFTTSKVGIISILAIWIIYIGVSLYGVSQVTIDFKSTYFISENSYIRNYISRQEEYFQSGETLTFYSDVSQTDITTLENQKKINTFYDNLKSCNGCQMKFTVSESLDSWFVNFQSLSESMTNVPGQCQGSWDSSENAVVPEKFMDCFKFFISTSGAKYGGDVNLNADETAIKSFRQSIKLIYIEDAAQEGPQVLSDMEKLAKGSDLGDTFSFTQKFFDFEVYVVFQQEAILNVCLALTAVFIVLMIITANFTVTMFILLCVILVDLFLLSLLTFWDITLNSVTVVNNVIAIGLAVDYSAHIGHSFLLCEAPDRDENGRELSNHEKRVYKARGALGSMGSSVFHGAFSTFLAIVVLAPSKSYIFKSFFRMWFGIILFGVANGFILLPVLLSLCGPLNTNRNNAQKAKIEQEAMAGKNDIEMKVEDLGQQNQMMEGGNNHSTPENTKSRVNQVQNTDTARKAILN